MRRAVYLSAIPVLAAAIFISTGAHAGVAEGKKAFEARKCASCHQVAGPAAEKTIKDQLSKKGPELWYSGSKFKAGFLEKWRADPRPIRPLAYNSVTERNTGGHPMLSGQEKADVAAYLMSLKSADVKPLGIQAADNPKGRIAFVRKHSCYGCHQVRTRGSLVGGFSGPSLAEASERLNPDWVYAYLSKPSVFKPVKMMPVYAGIINDAEMKGLAAYVGSLR
ncbi:MAG: c-type cytochrome [Deltaproteobacteria bacterium]|nr:c-type cytochrome [Deltaproteobacteria bacterium]